MSPVSQPSAPAQRSPSASPTPAGEPWTMDLIEIESFAHQKVAFFEAKKLIISKKQKAKLGFSGYIISLFLGKKNSRMDDPSRPQRGAQSLNFPQKPQK